MVVEDGNGKGRPALAPLAGAFGSGFVGVAAYRTHNTAEDGLRRSGMTYGGYFATAIVREFKPELMALAARVLKRDR